MGDTNLSVTTDLKHVSPAMVMQRISKLRGLTKLLAGGDPAPLKVSCLPRRVEHIHSQLPQRLIAHRGGMDSSQSRFVIDPLFRQVQSSVHESPAACAHVDEVQGDLKPASCSPN